MRKKGVRKVANDSYWPWIVVMNVLFFFIFGGHLEKYTYAFPLTPTELKDCLLTNRKSAAKMSHPLIMHPYIYRIGATNNFAAIYCAANANI
jgi:hypothetical protein